MGLVGIGICDMCGRRTEKFAGSLRLISHIKRRQGWMGESTIRSWRLCKRCLNKLSSLETIGDKVKEEIELKIDQIRVKHNEIKLLQ